MSIRNDRLDTNTMDMEKSNQDASILSCYVEDATEQDDMSIC
jgi:hypothetical protein